MCMTREFLAALRGKRLEHGAMYHICLSIVFILLVKCKNKHKVRIRSEANYTLPTASIVHSY
jgi:hypothetical protein